jgi:hypothetical protein
MQNFNFNVWEIAIGMNIWKFSIEQHDIILDISAPYKIDTSHFYQQRDFITVEHHYRNDIFTIVIDFMELNYRFLKTTVKLFYLSSALDPSHAFIFKVDNICKFYEKFYSKDFFPMDLHGLRIQLEYYKLSMDYPNF